MFRDLKARFRYQLDDIFARSSMSQFFLLVLLSIVVVLLGMTAYFFGLFSPSNTEVEGVGTRIDRGLWDSLWWSLKHMIDPGFFAENYGATVPVAIISLLIAVMGMVIFGILIGFISTSMEARLAALQRGNSPVIESGHVLILGWSNKIFFILRLLAKARAGLRIVVLARPAIAQMQESLRAAGILSLPIKVILRSGLPSNILELRRVAFDRARSIIVLSTSSRELESSGRDVEAIKTAMLLSSFREWHGRKPVLVSEINDKQNVSIARIAGRNQISIVSSSEVIGKVIVQAARQRGLSFVYSEILSSEGNSISVQQVPGCIGRRFGDIQYGFVDAVPIGVSWQQEEGGVDRYAAGLNPEPDYIIDADDQLVLLTKNDPVSYDERARPHLSRISHAGDTVKRPLKRILILGFNDDVHDILTEFDGHVGTACRIDLVSNFREDEAKARLAGYVTRPFRNVEVVFQRGDIVSAGFLQSLDVESYDCILTLADESSDDDPDARSIMTLLLLTDLLRSGSATRPVHVVSEIHDPRNRELVSRTAANEIIVSPEIVSMQLSQISQQPVLESIFRELLSAGGIEVCLRSAARYVEMLQPCTFRDLQYSAQAKMEIALGVRLAATSDRSDGGNGVSLNPRRDTVWTLCAEDDVVVLAQEIYD